jgi:hypothetical protein
MARRVVAYLSWGGGMEPILATTAQSVVSLLILVYFLAPLVSSLGRSFQLQCLQYLGMIIP